VRKPRFTFDLVAGTAADAPAGSFDAIVLCSTVHHIPDRVALLTTLVSRLAPGGCIVAADPTHHLARLRKMFRKARLPGYLGKIVADAQASRLSTHKMCTLAEYRRAARKAGLQIARVEFSERPPRVRRWREAGIPLGPLWRWAAEEIAIELCR
jgi:2-polyprenyl-3-methyl-5-hydroxy-6-metoxy-1,4-benzoquinol methylase